MRATIVGSTRTLSISCENGDKRFLGDVRIEGLGVIHEAFEGEDPNAPSQQYVDGFVSVYVQHSEALRRALIVRNLDKQYQQVIDRYADLRNLTTIDREGRKLIVGVMLTKIDFEYFARFIEEHFVAELQYVIDVPFHILPQTRDAQAEVNAKFGYVLPTKFDFRSGKPCFFPNAGISFGFEHPTSNRSSQPSADGS
jgi:hypothetical protein